MIQWTKPVETIGYYEPEQELLEKNKFALNQDGQPQWALDNVRYLMANYYNPEFAPNVPNKDVIKSMNAEIDENVLFYMGFQSDNLLGYMKSDNSVHVPGQHIRTLASHIEGNVLKLLAPVENQISAYSSNPEIVKARKDYVTWLELQDKLKEQFAMFAQQGVQYSDNTTPPAEDIEEAKENYKHEYEIAAEILGKSLYYTANMQEKFTDATKQVLYSNGASIHYTTKKTKDGQIIPVPELIPAKQRILDLRSTDQFLTDQRFSGFVQYKTPAEIFATNPSLTADQRQDISNAAKGEYPLVHKQYYDYPNLDVYTKDGFVAVIRMYWIGRRDLRYKLKENKYGSTFYSKLDDNKEYNPDHYNLPKKYTEKGKLIHPKGEDIAGDYWTWDVHYADVVMNKYVTNFGYVDYVVRDNQDKSVPVIPMVNLYFDIMDGYGRSIVGRLKYSQMQRDRYKRKLQELTEQDLGKNLLLYINDEDETELEILKTLRTKHVKIIKKSMSVIPDGSNKNLVSDVVDLTPTFQHYIELLKFEEAEQQAIINATPFTLGAQTTIVGKGVQENTIAAASMSMILYYTTMMKYFDKVLNYGFNLWKNCMKPGDLMLPLNKVQAEMITATKEFKASDMGLFIYGNDPVNEQSKQLLMQLFQSYGQNIQYLLQVGVEPLDLFRIFYMIQRNSANQEFAALEKKIRKNKAKQDIIQQQQAEAQQQQEQEGQAQIAQMQEMFAVGMAKMKEENANYRAEVSALSKNLSDLLKHFSQNPTEAVPSATEAGESQSQALPQPIS